jgi:hypothetical protein
MTIAKITLTTLIIFLSGCATKWPVSDKTSQKLEVQFATIVIDNLAVETNTRTSEQIYVNGWVPLHDIFKPTLPQAFDKKVRAALVPAPGATGRVDITLLRAGFWMEKSVADDVPFIGIALAFRERDLKCDVDVNIKIGDKSQRRTLYFKTKKSVAAGGQVYSDFVDICQDRVIKRLADILSGKIPPKE